MEESFSNLLGLLIVIVLVVVILTTLFFQFMQGFFLLIENIYFKITRKPLLTHGFTSKKGLSPAQENLLLRHIPFYKKLTDKKKLVFSARVRRFMNNKEFEGRQGLVVTDDMRVLIAATAVKLTFGLRNYLLSSFHTFIIYPEIYFSRATNSENKGETNPRGIIVYSWPDFMAGIAHHDDNLNLGLHELAHALFIDEQKYNRNLNFSTYYEYWHNILRDGKTIQHIRENEIFRAYGLSNENEFFAVAVENFFETPAKFKQELPKLYTLMCKILNINPLELN